MAGLEKQREQHAHAVEALSDPERTRLVLVARLQKIYAAGSSPHPSEELAAIGLKNQYRLLMVCCLKPKLNMTRWLLRYGNGSRKHWQIFLLVYLSYREIPYYSSQ